MSCSALHEVQGLAGDTSGPASVVLCILLVCALPFLRCAPDTFFAAQCRGQWEDKSAPIKMCANYLCVCILPPCTMCTIQDTTLVCTYVHHAYCRRHSTPTLPTLSCLLQKSGVLIGLGKADVYIDNCLFLVSS